MAPALSTLLPLRKPILLLPTPCLPFLLLLDGLNQTVLVKRELALAETLLREELLCLLLSKTKV